MKWYHLVGFTIVVMVSTLFIRIPLPGGGYFNFGDVTVIFVGLYAGSLGGALAGGIGSALADLIGFPVFAPITLLAKGAEGLISGLAKGRKPFLNYLFPILGALVMVAVYFFGTWILPTFGIGAAVAELPANLMQALLGNIGARALFLAVKRVGL
ncbi:MAG TPA: ECF transporter S component [Candidatus Cloacimonadota bacterium]|nr:ECF transporter S component [Candidatus Cloacimonadota bacterium]